MNKLLLNKMEVLFLSIVGLLLGVLLACLHISAESDLSLDAAFLYARDGYFEVGHKQFGADVLSSALNLLAFLPLISVKIFQSFETDRQFVFIRLDNLARWNRLKAAQATLLCLISEMAYHIGLLLGCVYFVQQFDNPIRLTAHFFFGVGAAWLMLLSFVLASYLVGLLMKPHFAATIVLGILTSLLVGQCFISEHFAQYYLTTHYYISWHLHNHYNSRFYPLPAWTYYTIISLVIWAEVQFGRIAVKRKDVI